MSWKTIRRPDAFDVALHGLMIAFGVGLIYFLQLHTMQGQLNVMQEDERPWVGIKVIGPIVPPQTWQAVLCVGRHG